MIKCFYFTRKRDNKVLFNDIGALGEKNTHNKNSYGKNKNKLPRRDQSQPSRAAATAECTSKNEAT